MIIGVTTFWGSFRNKIKKNIYHYMRPKSGLPKRKALKRKPIFEYGFKDNPTTKTYINPILVQPYKTKGYINAISLFSGCGGLDLLNAIRAYNENLLPVMMVLSSQINTIVLKRYQTAQLLVLIGILNDDPTISTYAFCDKILNYSLETFFRKNSGFIRKEINNTLESLLNP